MLIINVAESCPFNTIKKTEWKRKHAKQQSSKGEGTCLRGGQQNRRGGSCESSRRKEKYKSETVQEGGSREEIRPDDPKDQRSSVSGMEAVSERRVRTRSMALFSARRHSLTLRKAWTWARAGKACIHGKRDIEKSRQRKQARSKKQKETWAVTESMSTQTSMRTQRKWGQLNCRTYLKKLTRTNIYTRGIIWKKV